MKKFIFLLPVILFVSAINANERVSEIAEQYVRLVLALGEHDNGYVDAYYGPSKWQQQAAESPMDFKKIAIAAKSLQDVLAAAKPGNELERLRHAYLNTQLGAVASRAIMLIGNVNFDFDQQSQSLYDTQAPRNELTSFQPVLDRLDKLLPGEGSLSQRIAKFRQGFVIPQDKLKVVFDAAIKECRNRTKPFVNLLENENFKLEFVTDKPWSGYNWYKGNSFSLIQVNTGLPIQISRAVDLGCHEGYPGHHTYNGLLEANLYRKLGWVEYSVYPLFSPQSLIAEGSANYGIEMAFPGDEKLQFEKAVLYPLAGLDPSKAESYNAIAKLTARLSYAGNEVARLYLNGTISADKASALLQQFVLMSQERAQQRVKFMDTYGAYVINYNWGKDLVKAWVEKETHQSQQSRWARFAKLLSSPRLPSTLN